VVHGGSGVLRVPFIKFLLRLTLEILMLIDLACVLLLGPTSSPLLIPTPPESLLYAWAWALILDEYYQYRTASDSLADHFDSLWNRIDLLKLSTLGIASAMHLFVAIPLNRIAPGSGYEVLAWSRVTLAISALPAFTRVFSAISLDQKYGVLFLSCARMFDDIKRFMVLLGVVMLAFGLTFSGLASANHLLLTGDSPHFDALANATLANATGDAAGALDAALDAAASAHFTSSSSGFLLAFWAIHSEMIGHEVDAMPRMATLVLWIYFMFSQIVLLNLLVAIMGDTWNTISENADVEWKFFRVNAIAEYFELHHIPPPFNAARLLRALFDGSFASSSEDGVPRCTRQRTAADVKKLSKDAQRDLLKAWRAQADLEKTSQLKNLQASHIKLSEKLDLLSGQLSVAVQMSAAAAQN